MRLDVARVDHLEQAESVRLLRIWRARPLSLDCLLRCLSRLLCLLLRRRRLLLRLLLLRRRRLLRLLLRLIRRRRHLLQERYRLCKRRPEHLSGHRMRQLGYERRHCCLLRPRRQPLASLHARLGLCHCRRGQLGRQLIGTSILQVEHRDGKNLRKNLRRGQGSTFRRFHTEARWVFEREGPVADRLDGAKLRA